MNKERRKKQEILDEVLQTKITMKDDKVMYVQHNQGRECGCRGCNFGCNGGRSHENNNEERGQTNYSNSHGQDCDRGRGGRSNCPNVECYNCKKDGHYTKDCYAEKKVEENDEKDETKD